MGKQVSDYFDGAAAKYLSAVDAEPSRSNQHEIGGLPSVGFKEHLGEPPKTEKYYFQAQLIYISDTDETTEIIHDTVTWYDCRDSNPLRSPEYRLYYKSNAVTQLLNEGDFLLIAKQHNNSLLMVFTPSNSTIEHQLRALFGLKTVEKRFQQGNFEELRLVLPLQLLLEDLGIGLAKEENDDDEWLSQLLTKFGNTGFPKTSEFSEFARNSLINDTDPIDEIDATLLAWMEQEEKLFRILERHFVQKKLEEGFGTQGNDVDEFISFSLSVQNRRKSRVGHAFEGHIDTLFRLHGLRFEQGRGKGKVTENRSRPDFLFPDFQSYHDSSYPVDGLRTLGAKTTCKDRWRQVLSEADKIQTKHLITLEAAISEPQTNEMQAQNLQLVVPSSIQSTYKREQQKWLIDLSEFTAIIKKIQQRYP